MERRIEFTNPKSINFSKDLIDGSVARTKDQKARVVKNKISSKMMSLQGSRSLGLFFFLILTRYMVRSAKPKSITTCVSLVKGKKCRLPKNHIRYEEITIPITLVKIYPRSMNLRKMEVVIGRKIRPTTNIVAHQISTEEASDIFGIIVISFPLEKSV